VRYNPTPKRHHSHTDLGSNYADNTQATVGSRQRNLNAADGKTSSSVTDDTTDLGPIIRRYYWRQHSRHTPPESSPDVPRPGLRSIEKTDGLSGCWRPITQFLRARSSFHQPHTNRKNPRLHPTTMTAIVEGHSAQIYALQEVSHPILTRSWR